jgi:surface polysaccharide O-acyltransferase-like enzyme
MNVMERPLPQLQSQTSAKIVNLSFLCAIFVCMIHVRWAPTTEFGETLVFLFMRTIGSVAVPFFFVVSGYFLARHCEESGWWEAAIRKRIRSLVVPYCVWQIVYALLWFAIEHRWSLRPGAFGLNPFVIPKLVPLWYLRTLMIFAVLSPLIVKALRRWGLGFLSVILLANLVYGVFTSLGYVTETMRLGELLYHTFSLLGLLSFSIGSYLAMRPMTLSRRVGNWCGVAALAMIILRLIVYRFKLTIPFDWETFNIATLLAFLWVHTPTVRLPTVLARSTFPIYLMHVVIYTALGRSGFPSGVFGQWGELVIGVSLSIAISEFLHRAFPAVARILFGGR